MSSNPKHHILLNGDPVHGSPFACLMQSIELKSGAAYLAVTGLTGQFNSVREFTIGAIAGLVGCVAGTSLGRLFEFGLETNTFEEKNLYKFPTTVHEIFLTALYRDSNAALSIDKKPDDLDRRRNEKYRKSVWQLRNTHGALIGVYPVFYLAMASNLMASHMVTGTSFSSFMSHMATFAAIAIASRHLSAVYRFNKVAKNEWVIADTPAKKQEKDVWAPGLT